MRCDVARPVHEFLFEPKSRSGGRSAASSFFFLIKKNGQTDAKKYDLGPLMRVPSDAHWVFANAL